MAQKTITGTLKAVSEEEKAGKDVVVYQIMRDGMKFPDFITAWPDAEGEVERPSLRKGERYTFTVETKPKKDGKGEYLDYLDVAIGSPGRATAPAAPAAPSAAPTAPRPAQGQEARSEAPGVDPRGRSIERQVCLKAATDWCVARVQAGEQVNTYHVLQIANWFAAWLESGAMPREPKGAVAKAAVSMGAQVSDDEDGEEPLFPEREA